MNEQERLQDMFTKMGIPWELYSDGKVVMVGATHFVFDDGKFNYIVYEMLEKRSGFRKKGRRHDSIPCEEVQDGLC